MKNLVDEIYFSNFEKNKIVGIIKRQGLKSSIVNYIGVLIGVIFFNFIFPNLISKEYLGLIGLLRNLMMVFATLPALGLGHMLLRYYSVWKDDGKTSSFNSFAVIAMLISVIVFSLIYILLRGPIINYYQKESSLFIPYFYFVIPLVAIYTFNQYFELFSLVKLRAAVPAFLREVINRVLLIIIFYLFIYHFIDEKSFVLGFLCSYVLPFGILVLYSIKSLGFSVKSSNWFLHQNNQLKENLKYSGGMLLLVLFSTVHNFLDGIILPAYLGLGALGIYMPSLVLGQMIQVPYRSFALISIPVIREALVDNDVNKIKRLNTGIALNLFLIGSFLFTLLVSNTEGIFSLIPREFSEAKNVLYIVAAGRLLDMAFGLNSEIINYSKHYRYIIILSGIMMVMTIGLNILLIPMYGMNGAALAVSVSLIVFNVLKSLIIYQKFHFHCFSKHYITLIFISALVIIALYFIPFVQFVQHHKFINSLMNIIFKSTIGTILFLIPVYYFKVSKDFNDFFKLIISGKIFKGGHKMEEL